MLTNDTDLDGDGLIVTSVALAGGTALAVPPGGTTIAAPHGTLTIGPDGHLTYLATAIGQDAFTYTISDGHGGTAAATLTETVVPHVPDQDATFAFAFLDATVAYVHGEALLTGPDGVTRDVTGIGHLHFTDGTIDEKDGSPLVDDLFYFAQNHDVYAAGADPDAHYAQYGWREGRDPNPYFSTKGYLAANPDVAAAGVNPLAHYDAIGWKEGRDPGPDFSTAAYLAANAEVARLHVDPLAEFLDAQQGVNVSSPPSVGSHTITGDFDATYYLAENPDVAAAGVDPLQHYLTIGWKEGRDPDAYFSTKGYLAINPDVAAAGINPLLHYEADGWREGRDPSGSFDTSGYLAANPDVAAAHVDPLQHFPPVRHGRRTPRLGDRVIAARRAPANSAVPVDRADGYSQPEPGELDNELHSPPISGPERRLGRTSAARTRRAE